MQQESHIAKYGLHQIQLVGPSYPEEMDFSTSLVPDLLTDSDKQLLAPKKRTRGPAKEKQQADEDRMAKKRLLNQE